MTPGNLAGVLLVAAYILGGSVSTLWPAEGDSEAVVGIMAGVSGCVALAAWWLLQKGGGR